MSEQTYIILVLIGAAVLVTVIALMSKRNLRQILRLPGLSWGMETSDSSHSAPEPPPPGPESPDLSSKRPISGVSLGDRNFFGGSIGDIAGNTITQGPLAETEGDPVDSHVDFGTENVFLNGVGDVAGGSIIKRRRKAGKASKRSR